MSANTILPAPETTRSCGSGAATCSGSLVARTPKENKRERGKRWYQKVKSDPEKFEKLREKKRDNDKNRPDRKAKEKEKYHSLPHDHPRKKAMRKRSKRACATLTDPYVSHALGMKVSDCPQELMELKRASMMLCRKLGTRIKTA